MMNRAKALAALAAASTQPEGEGGISLEGAGAALDEAERGQAIALIEVLPIINYHIWTSIAP